MVTLKTTSNLVRE